MGSNRRQDLWPDGGTLEFEGGLLGKSGGLLGKAGGLLGKAGGLLGKSSGQGLWPDGGGLEEAGGGLLGKSGGLLGKSGGLLGKAGGLLGKSGGQELSFDHAKAMGKGRPSGVTACVIGRDAGCAGAVAFNADYHRIQVPFTPSPIGSFSSHEVQRKRASEPDTAFTTVDTTTTTAFTDPNELPNGVAFVYRIRNWPATATAVGRTPHRPSSPPMSRRWPWPTATVARQTLNVAAPGVLANDRDPDSPTAFLGRRAVRVAGPSRICDAQSERFLRLHAQQMWGGRQLYLYGGRRALERGFDHRVEPAFEHGRRGCHRELWA